MNISGMRPERYDLQTRQLMQEIWLGVRDGGTKNLRLLSRLSKTAHAMQDNALLGFVYYYYADAFYFMHPDYVKFRAYLRRAIRCLLHSDNRELLGIAYNLVAIDAHNCASFDIAYRYYTTSLLIAEETGMDILTGGVEANIGRLFNEIGYYELARTHLKNGIRHIRSQKDHPLYDRNMVIVQYLIGINALNLQDVDTATRAANRVAQILARTKDETLRNYRLPEVLLKGCIAATLKQKKALREAVDMLEEILTEEPQLFDYIEDIEQICNILIAGKELDAAKRIIDATAGRMLDCGVTHAEKRMLEICELYHDAAGEESRSLKCLQEIHARSLKEHAEQNSLNLYEIELSDIMGTLRSEQEKAIAENELLQIQAGTDALTGLPNRHVLNERIEAAFARAMQGKQELGISILDVDYFKEYNDSYGHGAGDLCLKKLSEALKKIAATPGVFAARYGGDEFVVIYENMNRAQILRIAKELQGQVSALKIPHKKSAVGKTVTVSQGICHACPAEGHKIWEYLSEADHALYAIKRAKLRNKRASGIRFRKPKDL